MRIALTITELDVGGAEKCLTDLAIWLARRDIEVKVLALGPPPPEERSGLFSRLTEAQIECSFGGFQGIRQAPSATSWLRKQLRAFQPQIVQSMLFHANVLTAVAKPRSCIFVGGARVRQVERSRQLLQAWAARRMYALVCVSQDVARHCEQVEGIPASKLAVIPNGVSPPVAEPSAERAGIPNGPIILSVGRLSDQKGFRELLLSADKLLEPLPTHQLVIVGSGPQLAELEAVQKQCRYGDRIHLAGWRCDVHRWLNACELFVLPTHYEGMPNALLEAMSHGKPVVINDVDGAGEVLGRGRLGSIQLAKPLDRHSPSDSAADLIDKALHLANNPSLAAEAGVYNLSRIRNEFSLETQLAKYLDLYRSLRSA